MQKFELQKISLKAERGIKGRNKKNKKFSGRTTISFMVSPTDNMQEKKTFFIKGKNERETE